MSLTPLLSMEHPALIFAGQGSPWQLAVSTTAAQPGVAPRLQALIDRVRTRTAPLAREIGSTVPGVFERLTGLTGPDATAAARPADAQPAVSVPGIVLGQIAAVEHLRDLGLDLTATECAGHSQGDLGVAAVRHPEAALALAVLMGTALSAPTAFDNRSRMLSVRGLPLDDVASAADAADRTAVVAVVNGPTHQVLSGTPEDLAAVRRALEELVAAHNRRVEERETGGDPLEPRFDELPVAAAFHNPVNAEAAATAIEWARRCGVDADVDAAALVNEIFINHFDWTARVADLRAKGVTHVLSLDTGLARMTENLLAGTGVPVIPAGSAAERDRLATPGTALPQAETWEDFVPRLVRLPDGEVKLQTRFSKLTGYSPVILAGMTPTTVDPDIVAAAANAGHWAEMAGGGQFSEEVFTANKDALIAQLEPGRAAQFNSMYFDRFLWNLQFGQQRIVSRARAAGAAINGVTVSAGIPEPEEARELLAQLHADGYPYVAFKPGTSVQIRATLAIADDNPDTAIIMQVEDGHAGGHHSWVNLDDMLRATYAEIRRRPNVTLAVGGGLGDPERAADYLLGTWSAAYGLPAMPVDAVLVGTAAMTAREAKTSPQVKELLRQTPGVAPEENEGWVGRLACAGGVTSGQSHLLADMHELDNDFAAASRRITELDSDSYAEHREELVELLSKTSKPYFGDVDEMTYAEWVDRFVDLAFPWIDPTWPDRFLDLVRRVEARLNSADHGEIPTLFPDLASVEDGPAAAARLKEAYPEAAETAVAARDAAWWVGLNRKHHKPMPWVTAIDGDLKRWFGLDSLWQSQDERYPASAVRAIPGPVSVGAITTVDEPVAAILDRYEQVAAGRIDAEPVARFARLEDAADARELITASPTIVWHGHLIDNPAHVLAPGAFELIPGDSETEWTVRVLAETRWDDLPERPYAVRNVDIPLDLGPAVHTGASPVVSDARLPESVFALLAGVAGVGSTSAAGDTVDALPTVGATTESAPYGLVTDSFHLPEHLLRAHSTVTGAPLGVEAGTPDVLVGPCWPAIYTALGTGRLADGYPVIEGLLNAVHFDHSVELRRPLAELAAPGAGRRLTVESRCTSIDESASGRIVRVDLDVFADAGEIDDVAHAGVGADGAVGAPTATDGTSASGRVLVATLVERFCIRGRAVGHAQPPAAPEYGDAPAATGIRSGQRSFVDRATVTAPGNMTAFAMVSGDYNPIHTSANAARLVGLDAPLVHGMWLSATAQHLAGRHGHVEGWTYNMYGMVQLNDEVEITVERVGRAGLHAALEVTCRIGGDVISRGQALLAEPKTAYVYPGQGVQATGMGAADRSASAAAREIWRRADRHTRTALGFSIRHIVDDNPTELTVRGRTFRHPAGVLNLTQFTQVALAVVAYAETERLRDEDAVADSPGVMYAGHSLGEYTALASLSDIFELEGVIDIVYSRGSAMGSLVPRDETGRSNYGLAALRPNMIGVGPDEVQGYVDRIAEQTGEFLEIVNYNIPGQQYSVAGTVAGLDALAAAANAVNPRALVRIPGIDVPFHSTVLRPGVAAFAEKLDELLPTEINLKALVGRYVPNLVARPFELTDDFLDAVRAVAPSERLAGVTADSLSPNDLARVLLIELLSWQFASPVRWIETQELLLDSVDQIVEVGLAASPTLANMAKRTMDVLGRHVPVFNVERDHDAVTLSDVASAPVAAADVTAADAAATGPEDAPEAPSESETVPAPAAEASPTPAAVAEVGSAAPTAPTAPAAGGSAADAPELPFDAADAIMVLFAFQNKIRLDQINDSDTVEELTNGVSSRRNQLLMDMSGELGVPAIDGAADADVATLRERVRTAAPGYHPFGSVLGEAVDSRLRTLTGAAGLKPAAIGEAVTGSWGLPESWVGHVEAEILLGSREGESVRGGELTTVPTSASTKQEVTALVDAAVAAVAARAGVSVSRAAAGGQGGGAVVDSAALDAFAETVTGAEGVLATAARGVLEQLGLNTDADEAAAALAAAGEGAAEAATLAATVEAELGTDWLRLVTPTFDGNRAVLFDDRWASAREELARIALGDDGFAAATGNKDAATDNKNAAGSDGSAAAAQDTDEEQILARFAGTGATVAAQANWWADNGGENPALLRRIAESAARPAAEQRFADQIALVTGAAPGSIAADVVARLLGEGATVIMTSSRVPQARKEFARTLYARHAVNGAALWLVPANLSSYRDVDALIDWIGTEQVETQGNQATVIKPALVPTLAYPFAAPSVSGSLAEAGPAAENQARLLLWSVERTIAGLSLLAQDAVDTRCHVVLPGSPNRGMFGGDGAYGEVKAALDAICAKWSAEAGWPEGVTLAQARIGWVAGTNLMGGNDVLVPAARAHGIHVWSPEEISTELVGLADAETRRKAASAPVIADLTGGLGSAAISITELAAEAAASADANAANQADTATDAATATATSAGANAAGDKEPSITALPNSPRPVQPNGEGVQLGEVTQDLDDMVLMVGLGEVSSWGSGRTRTEAEYGIHRDGSVELTAAGVLELAWMTGLVHWAEDPTPGWYDAEGTAVPEEEIYERYRDEVVARSGIRALSDKFFLKDGGSVDVAEVFLDRDITFTVPTRAEAEDIAAADPAKTSVREADGEWEVTRHKGATARVPRRATLSRSVAGQMPDDFDPARWGVPASMIDAADRITVWNLVTAVDAFISSGFSPAELLRAVHPTDVASTQGTGIGGMESLHKVFVSRFLGEDRPSDILQEALPNIVAAHVMQDYVGGYGAMIHPVAACATAAVSVEEGVDKIRLHKADVVVAGGIDDVQVESLQGFGDMNATAETAKMTAKGIDPRFISRPNDRRRGGFLEAEGGGTVLLARGSVAAELGLPVLAVVGYAASHADGAHTSIPAPGLGALGAARGGENSTLARSLRELGLTPDDVRVVSKHDTSTNANDPNESELHALMWRTVGRDEGNPLFVVSQKSLTGHAKGGAALFQMGELVEILRSGRLPQNASLDCVDPEIGTKGGPLVWLRAPLDLGAGAVKAGVLTSLGFGHVAAVVVLAHPAVFEAALRTARGEQAARDWRKRATARLRAGVHRLEAGMIGRATLYEAPDARRLPEQAGHEAEIALLLDADTRLGADGVYPSSSTPTQTGSGTSVTPK
ncbi:fatty acid synthase subunit beta domain-containing protein [Corynebacterium frankenforstense]